MHYFSFHRHPSLSAVCANACVIAGLLAPLSSAAVQAVPTDLQVVIQTQNSGSNPGPFSAGSNAMINASFRIDASVVPTTGGIVTSWNGALDDLVLTVTDSALGTMVIHGQNGTWGQFTGDFIYGGWDVSKGLSPFSVINPALSADAYVLNNVSFDFRGPALFANPMELPTNLSYTKSGASDFSFLDITLSFVNSGNGASLKSIIRGSAFESITVSPVPEPQSLAMLLAGLVVVGGIARRQKQRR